MAGHIVYNSGQTFEFVLRTDTITCPETNVAVGRVSSIASHNLPGHERGLTNVAARRSAGDALIAGVFDELEAVKILGLAVTDGADGLFAITGEAQFRRDRAHTVLPALLARIKTVRVNENILTAVSDAAARRHWHDVLSPALCALIKSEIERLRRIPYQIGRGVVTRAAQLVRDGFVGVMTGQTPVVHMDFTPEQ